MQLSVIVLGQMARLMDNEKSYIDGVTLTQLRQIVDERGAVLHMLRNDAPEFTQFGECYLSEIRPGAIKAWKRHKLQSQNLAVVTGRVQVVIYDPREKSSSSGLIQVFELGRPDAYFRLHLPSGLWYGFSCISQENALIVNCADIPHDPDESEIMPVDTSEIPYIWSSK